MTRQDVDILGYDLGRTQTRSPVSMEELDKLRQTVMLSEDDERALRQAGDVLEDQVEDVLDVWYGFIADHPHLVAYFATPEGEPIQRYLDRTRQRFGQWILDTCRRPYDQAWLDYQEEIALRHTSDKKNVTDDVTSPSPVPMRYLITLLYPVTATVRPFLASKGHSDEDVNAMHQAWSKAVMLQVALWTRPYVQQGGW